MLYLWDGGEGGMDTGCEWGKKDGYIFWMCRNAINIALNAETHRAGALI